ncbi:MAG: hypothetical protein IKH78_08025 [Ruminococcus sp.]|nr:hypothetical protein [Ruminococcus sp.]
MSGLDKYEGERVDIECKDGRIFNNVLVCGHSEPDDNYAAFEIKDESIDIVYNIHDKCGVSLYGKEIKSIGIVM